MTETADDIDDGLEAVMERFSNFGSDRSRVEKRRARERKAGLTAAQRNRRAPPTRQVNFRANDRTDSLLRQLAKKLDTSQGKVIAQAVELLAKHNGLGEGKS